MTQTRCNYIFVRLLSTGQRRVNQDLLCGDTCYGEMMRCCTYCNLLSSVIVVHSLHLTTDHMSLETMSLVYCHKLQRNAKVP